MTATRAKRVVKPSQADFDPSRREFLKLALSGMVGAATVYAAQKLAPIAYAENLQPHVIQYKSLITEKTIRRPYVYIYLDEETNYAVAINPKTGREIVDNKDHWYVIQEAIDALGTGPVSTRGGTILFSPGTFVLTKPLEIKHRRPIRLKGVGCRGADGDWGFGTNLELAPGKYDVFIDAIIDRSGPYDNDIIIEDMAIRSLFYAKYCIAACNYKLTLRNVSLKGGEIEKQGSIEIRSCGIVVAGNGPWYFENVMFSHFDIPIWILGDHVTIDNITLGDFRWAIVVGAAGYCGANSIFSPSDDLGLPNQYLHPTNVYITHMHCVGARCDIYTDTAAVVFHGSSLWIGHLYIEGSIDYAVIQDEVGTLLKIEYLSASNINRKLFTHADAAGIDLDSPYVRQISIKANLAYFGQILDVTQTPNIGFSGRAIVKIPAGTTLAAGRNEFKIISNATYKGYTIWRAVPITEPEIAMRFYVIDNDNVNPNELLLVVYNDSGASYTLTKDQLLLIELAQ